MGEARVPGRARRALQQQAAEGGAGRGASGRARAARARVARLVEQHGAVRLERAPLQAAAEDDQRRQRPAAVEAQVLCAPRAPSAYKALKP